MRIHPRGEQGQGLLSYALILVLVAIIVVTALATYGRRISYLYEEVNCAFSAYPQRSGPMTISSAGRTDTDTVWLTFNLATASEITFTDLRSGFSETFTLDPQQYTWISDDDSGHGHAGLSDGVITARTADDSFVCGKYPAEAVS